MAVIREEEGEVTWSPLLWLLVSLIRGLSFKRFHNLLTETWDSGLSLKVQVSTGSQTSTEEGR